MPRVAPEHMTGRRAQIVEAARACFARKGFHRTTLQDVFTESGLSAGCVYNYFRSKDELILAVAEARHQAELRVMEQRLTKDDSVAAVVAVAEVFVAEYLGVSELARRIAIETWSEAAHSPAILSAVHEGLNGPRKQLLSVIERGVAAGRFSPNIDADMAARTLIALLHGFILQRLWDPQLEVESAMNTFKRLLPSLLGYAAGPPVAGTP